jgi:uncharacterized protein YqgC (DUF456 family)
MEKRFASFSRLGVAGGMLEVAVWTLSLSLMAVGLLGVVVPMVPGTLLILVGAAVHKLLLPDDLTWFAVGWIALFWVLSMVADFGGVLLGARWFGGSKWGMAGAGTGAIVGLFFSFPALILGTIFGAMAAEKFIARKTGRESLRAGAGAALGFVISTVARLGCAAVMIGLFITAAGVWHY